MPLISLSLEKIRELAYLRKNHPRWVSALYFEDN
jgi:hypothetical protein